VRIRWNEVLGSSPFEVLLAVFTGQLRVAEDLRQQSRANGLATVHGNRCRASIWMPKKMVTAVDPSDLESGTSER